MDQQLDRSVSKVEVTGFEARNYDLLMNVITGGTYPFFVRRAVRDMRIQPDDGILVFGSGSGRNVCLMTRYLSEQGRVPSTSHVEISLEPESSGDTRLG